MKKRYMQGGIGWSYRPTIASSTTTDFHGKMAGGLGYPNAWFRSNVHEAIRHYFRKRAKKSFTGLHLLRTDKDYFKKEAASLEKEKNAHSQSEIILSVHHPAGKMKKPDSLILVALQIAARFRNIRVYLGSDWSLKEKKDVLNEAKKMCEKHVKEERFTIIPSLDMASLILKIAYTHLIEEGYRIFAFISRGPKKHIKLNYAHISDSIEDGIIKHLSGVTWRTRAKSDKARPVLLWAIGFDSIALRSNPPRNNKRKNARTLWDIELDHLKFFNPKRILIDRISEFNTKQKCPCPVHKRRSIVLTSNELYDTEHDGVLASCHDLHSMQAYLNRTYWQGKRKTLRENKRLLKVYNNFIGVRNKPTPRKK